MKNIKIRFQTQSNISWFVFITVAFVDYFNPFFLHRFLRERMVLSRSPASRATQTIGSAWVPAAAARTHARNSADRSALHLCSRCVGRSLLPRAICAPWTVAKGRA